MPGGSQLPSSVCALPHWPAPFPAVAHTSVAHAQSTRGAASRRHSWGSITGQRSMGPSLACETEGCDLRGGWGGFIAPRLPLPRRGGSLFQLLLGSLSKGQCGLAMAGRVSLEPGPGVLEPGVFRASKLRLRSHLTVGLFRHQKHPETLYISSFLDRQMKIPGRKKPKTHGLFCPLYLKIDLFSITKLLHALVQTFTP